MVQGVLVLIFWGVVRYLCCFPTSQCVLYDVLNSTSFFIQYCSVQVQFIHGGGGCKEKHDKASFYFGDGNMFRLHFNSRECQMFPKTVPFEKLKKQL
jgi:hypothetical protein